MLPSGAAAAVCCVSSLSAAEDASFPCNSLNTGAAEISKHCKPGDNAGNSGILQSNKKNRHSLFRLELFFLLLPISLAKRPVSLCSALVLLCLPQIGTGKHYFEAFRMCPRLCLIEDFCRPFKLYSPNKPRQMICTLL